MQNKKTELNQNYFVSGFSQKNWINPEDFINNLWENQSYDFTKGDLNRWKVNEFHGDFSIKRFSSEICEFSHELARNTNKEVAVEYCN